MLTKSPEKSERRAKRVNVAITANQLSAFSRLFSSAVFKELATKGRSAQFARLIEQSQLLRVSRSLECVSDAFEEAFKTLKRGACRDEYIYKTALTHRILLGKHNLSTACMMTEFRVKDCKADLVILNGTGTVFEIKSERDSLSRLTRQMDAYKRVFAKVFVIAGENHIDSVLDAVDSDVGVLRLSRKQYISTVREASDRADRVCPAHIFDSIRVEEAKRLLAWAGHEIPVVPNTRLSGELRKIFLKMEPEIVHRGMVETLKKTRNLMPLSDFVQSLPPSLQAAALTIPLKKADHPRLLGALKTNLNEAMGWA